MQDLVFLGNYLQREAEIIESILEGYNILTMRHYDESSQYLEIYMGQNAFGVDIFVSEDKIDKAREILESNFDAEDSRLDSENVDENKQNNWSFFRIARLTVKTLLTGTFIFIGIYLIWVIFSIIINIIL